MSYKIYTRWDNIINDNQGLNNINHNEYNNYAKY